jgi:hypothetical protein
MTNEQCPDDFAPKIFPICLSQSEKNTVEPPRGNFAGPLTRADLSTSETYDDELLWEMRIGQRSDGAFLPSVRRRSEQPGRRVVFVNSVQR